MTYPSMDDRQRLIWERVDAKARAIVEGQGHWGANILEEMRLAFPFELGTEDLDCLEQYARERWSGPLS